MFAARHKSQAETSQPNDTARGVSVVGTKLTSPMDRFLAAVAAGPLDPAERAAHWSACARVRAQDEMARAEPSPQADLLDAA
jgi:hypothetical protein